MNMIGAAEIVINVVVVTTLITRSLLSIVMAICTWVAKRTVFKVASIAVVANHEVAIIHASITSSVVVTSSVHIATTLIAVVLRTPISSDVAIVHPTVVVTITAPIGHAILALISIVVVLGRLNTLV